MTVILNQNQVNSVYLYLKDNLVSGSYYTMRMINDLTTGEKVFPIVNLSSSNVRYDLFNILITTGSENLYGSTINAEPGWYTYEVYDMIHSGSVQILTDAYTMLDTGRMYISGSVSDRPYYRQIQTNFISRYQPTSSQYVGGCSEIANIENSNGTYTASFQVDPINPFVLPDITLTEWNGTINTYPSVKNLTAATPEKGRVEDSIGTLITLVAPGATASINDSKIKDSASNVLYYVKSQQPQTILDNTITNTEGTVLVTTKAEEDKVVPDITITKATGIIIGYPAGKNYIEDPIITSGNLVRFIDFDGTILKTEYVATGGNATPPTTPIHTYLTFVEWNNSYANIQGDLDVGATYRTTDGKTYLFVTLSAVQTGLQPSLLIKKADTQLTTVDWGDGTTITSVTSGNVTLAKAAPYATEGSYIITITSVGNYSFDNSYIFSNALYLNILEKAYIGLKLTTIGSYALGNSYNLRFIMLPNTVSFTGLGNIGSCYQLYCVVFPVGTTVITQSILQTCRGLKYVVFPATATTMNYGALAGTGIESVILTYFTAFNNQLHLYQCICLKSIILPPLVTALDYSLSGCVNLEDVTLPPGLITMGIYLLDSCKLLRKIDVPSTVTTMGANTFASCNNCLQFIIRATTPPTLAAGAISGINKLAKIYVPDASVAAYKGATNWVAYADYIYPLSTLPA